MPNLRSKKLGGRFRGLFVGEVGTGKTIAAGSFPGPMKIYDFDDRIDPLIRFYPDREDIEYITVISTDSDRKDAISVIDFCKEFMDLQDRCDYETIVLDSLTNLSTAIVLYSMQQNGMLLGKGKVLPRPGFEEYKAETATMTKILEVIKGLPCHVIATAHPIRKLEITEPGKLESLETTYSLTGWGTKTPSMIPTSFNEMYYFYNQAASQLGQMPKRFISTAATDQWACKTALPLPPVFEVTEKPLYAVLQKYLAEYDIKLDTARKKAAERGAAATSTT